MPQRCSKTWPPTRTAASWSSPPRVSEVARRADIHPTAKEFAQAPSACIYFDLGIEQIPRSTIVSYLINVLLLITGNAGVAKGNTFIQQFGPKALYVHKQPKALVSDIEAIPMLLRIGIFPPNIIP